MPATRSFADAVAAVRAAGSFDDLLRSAGLGERLDREAFEHRGIEHQPVALGEVDHVERDHHRYL